MAYIMIGNEFIGSILSFLGILFFPYFQKAHIDSIWLAIAGLVAGVILIINFVFLIQKVLNARRRFLNHD